MIFTAAGVIFGFVLGYMVANARQTGTPGTPRPPAAAEAAAPPAAPKAPPSLDPSEVRALASLAEKERTNVRVRVELGYLLMEHDQHAEAVRWYGEALALDPRLDDVRVDMGACLVRLRRHEEALAAFDATLKNDPQHKKARFNKGVALMASGKRKEAVAVWDALLRQHPDDPDLQPLKEEIERVRAGGSQS